MNSSSFKTRFSLSINIFAAKGDCELSAKWVKVDKGHEMTVLYDRPVRSFTTARKQCRFHCGYLVVADEPEKQSTLESFLHKHSEFYHLIVQFFGNRISRKFHREISLEGKRPLCYFGQNFFVYIN